MVTNKFIPSTEFIEKLPNICVDLELVSIYDMDCYSVPQLLYRLAQKINDTITNMEHNDTALKAQLDDLQVKLEYLLGEGLTAELQKIIEKMYADGSLQALVEGAMVDINKRIDNIETKIELLEFDVRKYGATVNSDDNTKAFQDGLDVLRGIPTGAKLIVPKGTWKIKENLTMFGSNGCLELQPGAIIERPADSLNEKPLITIQGTYNTLKGAGNNSVIRTLNNSPEGVVAIGDTSVRLVTGACGYHLMKDLQINGKGSNSNGLANIGLYMNSEDGHVNWSYYHIIQNIHFRNLNTGVMLRGNANANLINNLTFTTVGANPTIKESSAICLKWIKDDYHVLDNVISNIFHTGSANAITVLQIGRANSNTLTNINGEPGGNACNWYKVIEDEQQKSAMNIIEGTGIYYGGYSIPLWYQKQNKITYGNILDTSTNILATKIDTENILLNGYISKFNKRQVEKLSILTGVDQAKNYEVFRYDLVTSKDCLVFELDAIFTSSVTGLNKEGSIKICVNSTTHGSITVDGYSGIEPMELFNKPVVSGNHLIFTCKTPSIGTATKFNGIVKIKVSGINPIEETKIVLPNTLTTYTDVLEQYVLTKGGSTSRQKGYFIGQTFYDTNTKKLTVYDGTNWTNIN